MSSMVAPRNSGDCSTSATITSDGDYPYPVGIDYNPSLGGGSGSGYYEVPSAYHYSSAPPTPEYPPAHLLTPSSAFYAPYLPDIAGSSYSQHAAHYVPQQQHLHAHQHPQHSFHLPPSSQQQHHHHVQQMYYGPTAAPWPVPSLHTALMGYQHQQPGHYSPPPPYPTTSILPVPTQVNTDVPRRRGSSNGGRRSSLKQSNKDLQQQHPSSYGSLELNVFDVENYDQLVSALNLVKRNSQATLFDIEGTIGLS